MGEIFKNVLVVSIKQGKGFVQFSFPDDPQLAAQAAPFCFPEQAAFRSSRLLSK
jgi:hypothetical protein